jgi:hypothetical protein
MYLTQYILSVVKILSNFADIHSNDPTYNMIGIFGEKNSKYNF